MRPQAARSLETARWILDGDLRDSRAHDRPDREERWTENADPDAPWEMDWIDLGGEG